MNNVYLDKILYIKNGDRVNYLLPNYYVLIRNSLNIYPYNISLTKKWLKDNCKHMKVYDLNNNLIKINKKTRIYVSSKRKGT